MNSQFKPGDVVQLKSGSPLMTVENVGDYSMSGLNPGVQCVWFNSNEKMESVFHPECLEHYRR